LNCNLSDNMFSFNHFLTLACDCALKKRKEKEREQEKKKKKKEKVEKRAKGPITESWGKYGIIKEIDMWSVSLQSFVCGPLF
jgi:hypothetical protein